MNKKTKKRKKLHIKWKTFLILLLCLFLSWSLLKYYLELSVTHIYITGTDILKDYEIIEKSGLKNYPKINKYSKSTIEKKIKELDLVENVKVKKNIMGKVSIIIKEARVLFYDRNIDAYVLSNGKVTNSKDFVGIPFLVNYVPDEIYERLIKDLGKVKQSSLALVSEIEYDPSKSGDIVIDNTRFLLRMNDGNKVHINLIHIDRLDIYDLTYTTIPNGEKGILEMDSDNDRGYWHKEEVLDEEDIDEDDRKTED